MDVAVLEVAAVPEELLRDASDPLDVEDQDAVADSRVDADGLRQLLSHDAHDSRRSSGQHQQRRRQ